MAVIKFAAKNNPVYQRRKTLVLCIVSVTALIALAIRIGYLMTVKSEYYSMMAEDVQERERDIKAARGRIIDRTGVVLADNKTVCTISVIHNQITDAEKVISVLSEELNLSEEFVRKRVEKYSSREYIKSNVDKDIGDRIRDYGLDGVKIDEDYKRHYPFGNLASKVLGFTGADNQGIIGLEVKYDEYMTGQNGQILTLTDAKGIEQDGMKESRIEPVAGDDLYVSLDVNIQRYATALAYQAYESCQAKGVSIIVMDVNNGEILAMADVPEFDPNDPFTLIEEYIQDEENADETLSTQDLLNQMWRNGCISDTYEPGSTFKIITASAALESGVVSMDDYFNCPGYTVVADRRIRCHKTTGHGSESFVEGFMVSCNPVFVNVGLRIGASTFYDYFSRFGLMSKTGIDLPGEAGTIMHNPDNIGNVELATISFGQSFQITPIRLMTTVAGIINGGNLVTPHLGIKTVSSDGDTIEEFTYPITSGLVSDETTENLKYMLEKVVSEGGGVNAYIEGYRIGGKTATSQTLPRNSGNYIASFIGFAPADNPQVMAIAIIDTPQGQYYGGQIAAPVVRELFENILPYLAN